MSLAIAITGWIGALCALVAARLLFADLKRVPDANGTTARPRVSVIIPARDEAANLSKLLPALNHQSSAPFEILVVDDQSSDATAAIAEAAGARLIRGEALPDGWFGKPWACQQGADAATGDWMLFLDADVEPAPDALERISGLAEPDTVVSICPWHRIETPFEELSVFFNLMMVGCIGAFTSKGDDAPDIGMFGQTMLISRRTYDKVGGHAAVKRTVLENFHLAQSLERLGIRRVCRTGRGCISMRMFPGGFGQLVESWTKGFASGADLTPRLPFLFAIFWITGLMMTAVSAFIIPLAEGWHRSAAGAAFLFTGLGLVPLFRAVGRFSWWNALAYPLTLIFYQVVFAIALRRKRTGAGTQWKGRHVD